MIIGIDASRANTYQRTGTEWYSFFIVDELLKNDRENKYVLYLKEPLVEDVKHWADLAEIKILSWPPKFLWSLFRLSWEMIWHKPDRLFVPAHTIPLVHPENTVTTCHDVGFERYPELYANKPIGPNNRLVLFLISFLTLVFSLGKYRNNELDYHRFSMKLAINKAKDIITVSNFTKQEIINIYKVNPDKINVIYPGLNYQFKKEFSQDELEATLLENSIDKPYFIFVGRLEKKKNIDLILKSFRIVKEEGWPHKLLLIGKPGWGFDNYWAELSEDVKKHIYIKNIWNKLPQIMASAEALVFPSAYEGFGLPVIEAMASHIPVIISDKASLPEIAGEAALIINDHSEESLAKTLIRIIEDKGLKEELVKKGNQQYQKYDWPEAAKKTLQIILD